MLAKRKVLAHKKNSSKTGGGISFSSDDGEEEQQNPSPSAAAGPLSSSHRMVGTHERILSLLGPTVVEGIRGVKELELPLCGDEDADDLEPQPKRARLGDAGARENWETQVQKEVANKRLENSQNKIQVTEKVAEALNNIAMQISRLADILEISYGVETEI